MNICKTDYIHICRYLDEAAAIICENTDNTRSLNKARLMRMMSRKLKRTKQK